MEKVESKKHTFTCVNSKDAKDFAAVLQAQGGGLYAEAPVAKVLTDREVTRDAVIDGLEWLEKQATSRDVAIVYLAGQIWLWRTYLLGRSPSI